MFVVYGEPAAQKGKTTIITSNCFYSAAVTPASDKSFDAYVACTSSVFQHIDARIFILAFSDEEERNV